MIKSFIIIFITGFLLPNFTFTSEIPDDLFAKFDNIKGKYLGQTPPGIIPELFDPFKLDYKTHHIHSSPVFSPTGDTLFFSIYVNDQDPQKIFYTKMSQSGIWSKPLIAPFSGVYHEGRPVFSLDGQRLYFYSKRPFNGKDKIRKIFHIWFVEKKNNWGKPDYLILPSKFNDLNYPSHFGQDGYIYFRAKIENEGVNLFKGRIVGNKILSISKIDRPVTVDPKEEYLIYDYFDKKLRKIQFKIGFKNKDNSWSKAYPMGETINNKQTQSRFPGFSPDKKYFFFTSNRSGHEKNYWVSRKLFETFKKRGKK